MNDEIDERPMCDRVTEYAIQHTGGKCPRRAVYKLVNRTSEAVLYRCTMHNGYFVGWAKFKLGKDGKAIPPGSRRDER